MKSVQLIAADTLEVREIPLPPDPGPGEVVVKVRAVGICGSDMHWYHGGIGHTRSIYPQILGHEPAGEIAATGPGVSGLAPGQKVAIEPAITCGHCELCRAGRHNACVRSRFMSGPDMPGLFREYALVPAHNAVPVPSAMSFDEVTLLEPLAVILHILELTQIRIGDVVAVMGAGPVGLLMASMARIAGARQVFIADKVPHRLQLAREMGVDLALHTPSESVYDAVMDRTRGRGVDLVFDAAGAPETFNTAIRIARNGGKLTLIGIPEEVGMTIDIHSAMNKELNIQTIKRSNHNVHGAIELLESGKISRKLVTHHFPLERTPEAFQTLSAYACGVGKVIIEIP
jgi:L-iditol 2-dehydrogenase